MTGQLSTTLPADKRPYLLRDSEGPRYLFGTQLASLIATAQSSGSLFELVALSGGKGDAFPAHRHTRAHEAIYVLNGLVELTLDGSSYLLAPGDYAHIPASRTHAYYMRSHHTRLLSCTSKGEVANLYSLVGEPTELRVHPPQGEPVNLRERLADAGSSADIALADDVPAGDPQPVTNTTVPDGVTPYVIASGGGIHRVVGRDVYTLLATQATTGGEFIALDNEGPRGTAIIQHFHELHTETFFAVAGQMTMWANGQEFQLQPGDFLHVPPGTVHSFRLDSHYTKFFSVFTPGLFEPFFHTLGTPYEGHIFPAEPGPARFDRLMQHAGELDLKIVGPPPDGSGGPGGPGGSGDPGGRHA
jgi:quercetin 2,3-dioxygenase